MHITLLFILGTCYNSAGFDFVQKDTMRYISLYIYIYMYIFIPTTLII